MTVKRVLADIIIPQSRPIDILITALDEPHLRNIFDMVDTRSNMQLTDLNSKPHGGKSLTSLIDCAIAARFYHPICSEHYKLL